MCRPPVLTTLVTTERDSRGPAANLTVDSSTWVKVSAYKGQVIFHLMSSKFTNNRWKDAQRVSMNPDEARWLLQSEKIVNGTHGRIKVTKAKGAVTIQRTDGVFHKEGSANEPKPRLVQLSKPSMEALKKLSSTIVDTVEHYESTVAKKQRHALTMTEPEFVRNVIVACAYQVYRAMHARECGACFGMEINTCTGTSLLQWTMTIAQALRTVTREMLASVYASNGVDTVGKDLLASMDGHLDGMIDAVANERVDEDAKSFLLNHYTAQQYVVQAAQTTP